ncbi:serine/threonine protein kinase PpkA [Desulfarculus baarsii DSM 2075]|uniref:Serine/threonine protein kinase PpkA n=1 Tax=Desulfarculus baarsii (strain ATCC 33931 / DSM 2075 / LMG 7858 / VKM B-1802 / 2st14) TaxID=644282 RepID=E1QGY9_DESB2|nr:vWA domain-containing protein [Desulfarculus baarsii]ADK84832.1 serine/threonine protein kinase PpkA [Desulfarculus baarsii DSM 2075]
MKRALLVVVMALIAVAMAVPATAAEGRQPVKIDGKKHLPLRVLARPFSHIYKTQDVAGGTAQENVPSFQPFYVYTRPSEQDRAAQRGWYEVGSDARGGVIGWMQAKDVFEWKQAMCLAYTHPEGRKPVLMFAEEPPLAKLVAAPPAQRDPAVEALYKAIADKNIPVDFPVKSVEPQKAVDISKQFYLLPILDFKVVDFAGREGRVVKLAAVTAGGPEARQASDIRSNTAYVEEATQESTQVAADTLKNLVFDVVFVMDTTVSMRPNIEATLRVIRQVAANLGSDPEAAQGVRFGFWGYRDSAEDIPGIEYTTKNYTPTLQTAAEFENTLAGVQVTEIDSVDYPEDVFSGVDDAMRKTAWDDNAIKFMVLVGDAPGHELGHKWNLSGQDENTLRSIADDGSFYLLALHVKNPKATKHNPRAEQQYGVLGLNKGSGGQTTYTAVDSQDAAAYGVAAESLTQAIVSVVRAAKQGQVAPQLTGGGQGGELADLGQAPAAPAAQTPAQAPAQTPPPASPPAGGELADLGPEHQKLADDVQETTNRALRAALVEWIGQQTGAQAPRDIEAWAVDKDLLNPAVSSMEVRLLINKQQLSSLKQVLTEVMGAGRLGQIGGDDFFTALQSTAAAAARDPNQIKNARTMAETGLVPEFLLGLPYQSRLMAMTNELWQSWGPDEQDEFLNELEARISAYQAIHDGPDGWIKLNPGDDAGEMVYPISLDLLP